MGGQRRTPLCRLGFELLYTSTKAVRRQIHPRKNSWAGTLLFTSSPTSAVSLPYKAASKTIEPFQRAMRASQQRSKSAERMRPHMCKLTTPQQARIKNLPPKLLSTSGGQHDPPSASQRQNIRHVILNPCQHASATTCQHDSPTTYFTRHHASISA